MLENITLSGTLTCRLAKREDDVFLEQLFRYTREDLYQLPMPAEFIDQLVAQQYQLQQSAYRQQSPDAKVYVIESMQVGVGKIMLQFAESSIQVVDFSLLPSARRRGFGTLVLQSIQSVAQRQNSSIKLSVDRMNLQAKKLYLTLGFVISSANETHEVMVWRA